MDKLITMQDRIENSFKKLRDDLGAAVKQTNDAVTQRIFATSAAAAAEGAEDNNH